MQLEEKIIEEIKHIAGEHETICKVILFGSRARGEAYKVSNMEELKDDFFIEQVEKDGVPLYEKP